jgi:antitoxin (DNA-binding transcriptional repressor) of toxin-antitoxin stability system
MIKANLYEIKTQFSKYVELIEGGETVVICKRNVPVAEIRPIVVKQKKQPELGWAQGKFEVPSKIRDLSKEDLLQWEGDEKDPLQKYARKPRTKK